MSLEAEAPAEVFVLETSHDTVPQGVVLQKSDLSLAKSDAEALFVATVADIDQKVEEGSWYSLIRAAGLLRQLLLDPTPLVHEVNRKYRKRIEFEVIDFRERLPLTPQAHWQNPDPSRFPGAMTVKVSLDSLLGAPSLVVEGVMVTVHDLIAACANVKGGIHLGKARTAATDVLIDWDRAFTLIGEEPSLRALAGLCRAVIRGLSPLVEEIVRTA